MNVQLGESIPFAAHFTASKAGSIGLTVTVDVYRNGVQVVTGGATTEVGSGLYRYVLAGASVTESGDYLAVFKTTDTGVDQKEIPAMAWADKAGTGHLDADVSSRQPDGPVDLTLATETQIDEIHTQTERFKEITPETAPLDAIEAPNDATETRCQVSGYWRRLDRRDGTTFNIRFELVTPSDAPAKAGGYLLTGRKVELTGVNGEISGMVERNDLIGIDGSYWLVNSKELRLKDKKVTLEASTFDLRTLAE